MATVNKITPGTVYTWARKNMPKGDVDTNRSDLYVKKTDLSKYMVENLWDDRYSKPHLFRSQIDGKYWYEFPMAALYEHIMRSERSKKRRA